MTYGQKQQQVIYCDKASDIPQEPHYAIVESSQYYEHDSYDERGGGITRNKVTYIAYLNKQEWEAAVAEKFVAPKYGSAKDFKAMYVNVAEITVKTSVIIK